MNLRGGDMGLCFGGYKSELDTGEEEGNNRGEFLVGVSVENVFAMVMYELDFWEGRKALVI